MSRRSWRSFRSDGTVNEDRPKRQDLSDEREVLQEGAEVMDRLFGSLNGDLVEHRRRASEIDLPRR